jgi:hypothetical protein
MTEPSQLFIETIAIEAEGFTSLSASFFIKTTSTPRRLWHGVGRIGVEAA